MSNIMTLLRALWDLMKVTRRPRYVLSRDEILDAADGSVAYFHELRHREQMQIIELRWWYEVAEHCNNIGIGFLIGSWFTLLIGSNLLWSNAIMSVLIVIMFCSVLLVLPLFVITAVLELDAWRYAFKSSKGE